MAYRFYTADFHVGMAEIIKFEHRPFNTVNDMNNHFVDMCNSVAKSDDVIYHIGDLFSFKSDNGNYSTIVKPVDFISKINAMFLNIRGNHDSNNKVFSIADSIRLNVSTRFPNVSLGHYPSYDRRSRSSVDKNSIHLTGHVHKKWKHCLDLDNNVMNINVGVDAWEYNLVSNEDLIRYLNALFRHHPNDLYRCKTIDGKLVFDGSNRF